jgi:uncharacterized protein (TIGR03435 family)
MASLFALSSVILSFVFVSLTQTPESLPRFEAADIRSGTRNATSQSGGGFIRGHIYQFRNATMADLISEAYEVEAEKVLGGPSWLEWHRFDILAKVPPGTTSDLAKRMLRSLLLDRFGLLVHSEDRPVPAYVLSVARGGSKLKHSKADVNDCQGTPQQVPPGGGPPYSLLRCRGTTMAAFSQVLPKTAPGYINRVVVDQTGLQGIFDFDLKWSARGQLAAGGVSLFDALAQQLGLQLNLGSQPSPVIMVDAVKETPTQNSRDAENVVPKMPTEFEVADQAERFRRAAKRKSTA